LSQAVTNPVLAASPLPYGLPDFDAISDDDFEPALTEAMADQRAEVAEIIANPEPPTLANTVVALENSGQALASAARVFYGVLGPDSTPARNDIAARLAPALADHRTGILADPALFARLSAVWEARDELDLDVDEHRLVDKQYRDAVRAGAALDEQGREEMRRITTRLADLTTEFGRLILEEANDGAVHFDDATQLHGLSAGELAAAAAKAVEAGVDGYLVALELPTSQASVTELTDTQARQRVFGASLARGSRGNEFDTRALIAQIVALRARRAELLGYPDHAAYVVDEETAPSVDAVEALLSRLVDAVTPAAEAEAEALRALAGGELTAADYTFWLARHQETATDGEGAADSPFEQYCELDRVLRDGVFFAAGRLYGLTFAPRPDLRGYHPDVAVFEVFDDRGEGLGLYLADLYARSTKRGGAWMTSFVEQSREQGTKPVVVNVMNIPHPADGQPTLLSLDLLMTLFHEFGHALHGLLSDVRFVSQSGTSVPRDFVEFPSQVNEHWALHPDVVANYARHVETGEPAPAHLVEKVRATGTIEPAHATVEYLGAAIVDLGWHRLADDEIAALDPAAEGADADGSVAAVERRSLQRLGAYNPLIPPRYLGPYFNHIFAGGYSAAYYAYVWSEVLDAATREWFDANGGLRRELGQRFASTILSKGDSVEPLAAHRELIGQIAPVGPLLRRRGLA